MTSGLIDSASMTGALLVLQVGRESGRWNVQSLFEVTHLLLRESLRLAPGPESFFRATGPIQEVLHRLPTLRAPTDDERQLWEAAGQNTLASAQTWANGDDGQMKLCDTLKDIEDGEDGRAWVAAAINFWPIHVQMHGALFNAEFIAPIAKILNVRTTELTKVHARSQRPTLVSEWAREGARREEAAMARSAYVLAALVRGYQHACFANAIRQQLSAHPFRRIGPPMSESPSLAGFAKVSSSEQRFIAVVVGNALREDRPEKRIRQWVDNVVRARTALASGAIALPDAIRDEDAERHAHVAATTLCVTKGSESMAIGTDLAIGFGLGKVVGFLVASWAGWPFSLAPFVYRALRGRSPGVDIAARAHRTSKWYRRLEGTARDLIDGEIAPLSALAPGRIEPKLALPTGERGPNSSDTSTKSKATRV